MAIDSIKRILKDWGFVLATVGAGSGFYHEHLQVAREVKELRDELAGDRVKSGDLGRVGPSGFSNPELRAAVDLQIERWIFSHECPHAREHRQFIDSFFQLNPTLLRPVQSR